MRCYGICDKVFTDWKGREIVITPRLVTTGIETLASLRDHLQTALQLEHATIPPYFTAWLSVNENLNPQGAEVIRTVMLEEMLHLTLVANLMNAVGGRPEISGPDRIPTYPERLPHCARHFEVSIERYSADALETFLNIELPAAQDAEPQPGEYRTIGQFYSAIADGIDRLCETLGEANVFLGEEHRQLRPEDYYGSGRLIVVRDRSTALKAIEEIREQGEGTDQSPFDPDQVIVGNGPGDEPAHYFRFKELLIGKRYVKGDTVKSGPTGESIVTDLSVVYPITKNPTISDYRDGSVERLALEAFSDAYACLLFSLEEAFNGKRTELVAAMARMFAVKNQALALMRMPCPNDPAATVGLVFKR
jgi:hypothetical protein